MILFLCFVAAYGIRHAVKQMGSDARVGVRSYQQQAWQRASARVAKVRHQGWRHPAWWPIKAADILWLSYRGARAVGRSARAGWREGKEHGKTRHADYLAKREARRAERDAHPPMTFGQRLAARRIRRSVKQLPAEHAHDRDDLEQVDGGEPAGDADDDEHDDGADAGVPEPARHLHAVPDGDTETPDGGGSPTAAAGSGNTTTDTGEAMAETGGGEIHTIGDLIAACEQGLSREMAEQEDATARSSRRGEWAESWENTLAGMQELELDERSQGEITAVVEMQRQLQKDEQQTAANTEHLVATIQTALNGIKQRHMALYEAHQAAPVRAAKREAYEG